MKLASASYVKALTVALGLAFVGVGCQSDGAKQGQGEEVSTQQGSEQGADDAKKHKGKKGKKGKKAKAKKKSAAAP